MKEFLKNGRIVLTPLEGVDYDLKQLNEGQLHDLNVLVSKQRTGVLLTGTDTQRLMELRKAARRTRRPTPQEQLQASIRELKELFR